LTTEIGEVEFDPRLIDQQAIISTTDDTGFDAALVDSPQRAKISFLLKGMNNYEDKKRVEEVLCDLKGVWEFTVSAMAGKVETSIDSEVTGLRAVADAVENSRADCYKVVLPNPYTWVSSDYGAEVGHLYQLFLWSCAFSVSSITIWCVFLDEDIVAGLKDPETFTWLMLMEVLVTLGTTAAYVYSVCGLLYSAVTGSPAMTYFETSAMLFSFVLLGKYRESLTKGKTSEAIVKLLELAPTTAILLTVDSSIVLITYMLFLIMKATHLLYSK
jgi:Cu+-exporting ATPase